MKSPSRAEQEPILISAFTWANIYTEEVNKEDTGKERTYHDNEEEESDGVECFVHCGSVSLGCGILL